MGLASTTLLITPKLTLFGSEKQGTFNHSSYLLVKTLPKCRLVFFFLWNNEPESFTWYNRVMFRQSMMRKLKH